MCKLRLLCLGVAVALLSSLLLVLVFNAEPTLPVGLILGQGRPPSLRVAFVGNSLTFFNDLPHLVQHLLARSLAANVSGAVEVGACLRGGKSLLSVWEEGCNQDSGEYRNLGYRDMRRSIASMFHELRGWDVVVLQDFSRGPAQENSRKVSTSALRELYFPALRAAPDPSRRSPLMVLYQTWGYRQSIGTSYEIGYFDVMCDRLAEGYAEYASLSEAAGFAAVIAQVGRAFQKVQSIDPKVWWRLYRDDNLHPSTLGTALASVHIASAIANSSRLKSKFESLGLAPLLAWPDDVRRYSGEPKPTSEELYRLFSLAGPQASASM